jgi:hypothetical protein
MENVFLNTGGHESRPLLKFMVEGRMFEWKEQYITDAQIKKIAGLPENAELYLSICEPWQDEPIKPGESINLARPEIEQFFIKKTLSYSINGVKHTSLSQYIRGGRVRQLGNIPDDQDLFLVVEKPWEDEPIENSTWVNLARPGIEQFVSRKVDHHLILIVNAREKDWNNKTITFKEVVTLHYGSFDPNPKVSYSITYKNGPRQNPEGIMSLGETLFVKNKMQFHVSRTNES